jgi:hypothetical protein
MASKLSFDSITYANHLVCYLAGGIRTSATPRMTTAQSSSLAASGNHASRDNKPPKKSFYFNGLANFLGFSSQPIDKKCGRTT